MCNRLITTMKSLCFVVILLWCVQNSEALTKKRPKNNRRRAEKRHVEVFKTKSFKCSCGYVLSRVVHERERTVFECAKYKNAKNLINCQSGSDFAAIIAAKYISKNTYLITYRNRRSIGHLYDYDVSGNLCMSNSTTLPKI